MSKLGKLTRLFLSFILVGGLIAGGIALLSKSSKGTKPVANEQTSSESLDITSGSGLDSSNSETSSTLPSSSEEVSETPAPSSSEEQSSEEPSSSEVSSSEEQSSEELSSSEVSSSEEESSETPPAPISYAVTPIQWGSVGSYGPIYWHDDSLGSLPSWSEVSYYNNNTSETYQLDSDAYQNARAVVGSSKYDILDETVKERVDSVEYSFSSLDYSGSISSGVDIAFAYSTDLFNRLVEVAYYNDTTFELPCLVFDDTVMARFVITTNGVSLKTLDSLVNSVEFVFQQYHEYTSTSSGDPGQATYYSATYILFHFNPGYIDDVTTVRLLSSNTSGNYANTCIYFFPKSGQSISHTQTDYSIYS